MMDAAKEYLSLAVTGCFAPAAPCCIDRRDLFVRELVARKVVVTKFVPTAQNVADILTKPLPRQAFQKHRATLLGIQE